MAELVGIDDKISLIIWSGYLLVEQGYQVRENICYQDNQSTARLAVIGRASSSKITRHINARYFFVTHQIKSGDMKIKYIPTMDMIGDYLTNPLHGSLFQMFFNSILGIEETYVTM